MTLEDLQAAHDAAVKEKRPFEASIEAVEKKYRKHFEKFLDTVLKDKNNETIKVGDYITDGKRKYHVLDRGLQNLFGTLMNNPRVIAVPENGRMKKHIRPDELKQFEITT